MTLENIRAAGHFGVGLFVTSCLIGQGEYVKAGLVPVLGFAVIRCGESLNSDVIKKNGFSLIGGSLVALPGSLVGNVINAVSDHFGFKVFAWISGTFITKNVCRMLAEHAARNMIVR